jgi:hypothetical protein
MGLHSAGGRTVATGATANISACALWNPHASSRVWVTEISWAKTVATVDNPMLIRTTTRGTQVVTVTPDIDNSYERDIATPTGVLIDVDYSAEPTQAGPHLKVWNCPAAIGSGYIWRFDPPGICVPFGTGLAVGTIQAVIVQPADVTYVWNG